MKNINYKILYLIQFFIGLLLINACSEEDIEEEVPLEIYPLKVGNSWTYQRFASSKDDSAKVINDISINIVRDTLINGNYYYLYDYNGNTSTEININKDDGFYINNIDRFHENDVFQYKYPCKIGDTWERIEFDEHINQTTITLVKALNTKITVPYGNIECIEYERFRVSLVRTNDTLYFLEHFYLKPGLGLVKSIHTYKNTFDGIYEEYRIDELKSAIIK